MWCVFSSWSQTFPFWWMFSHFLISFLDIASPHSFLHCFQRTMGTGDEKQMNNIFFTYNLQKEDKSLQLGSPHPLLPVNCYQLYNVTVTGRPAEQMWRSMRLHTANWRSPFPIFSLMMSLKLPPFSCQVGCAVFIWDNKPKLPVGLENLLQSAGAGGRSEKGWREVSVRASSKAGEIPHRVILFVWSCAGNKAVFFVQKQCAFKKPDSSELMQCPHTWRCKGQFLIPFVLG